MKPVVINSKDITLSLFIVVSVLTVLSLVEQAIGLTTGLFNLGTDASLPSWYASLALLLSALLLSFIASEKRRLKDRYARHWTWLSIIFYVLSADEAAMIHERAGDAFQESTLSIFATRAVESTPIVEGFFHYAWVLIAIPAVSIFLLSYLRFVLRLPSQVRTLFIAAATIFLMGAIGMETLAGYHHYLHGNDNWTYELLTTLEEFLEMVGVVVFIHALLQYASTSIGDMKFAIEAVTPSSELLKASERAN